MDTLTLGQQLTAARKALNLSVQDVAKQTQLKEAHIESLENDVFILPNVAPVFVRGYVRSYVRFLRLPDELTNSVNYGEVSIPNAPKATALRSSSHSQGKLLKALTILVLLVAFGMTLLWWWQEHQKEQQHRETLVNTAVISEAAPVNASNDTQTTPSNTVVAEPVVAVENNAQPQPENSVQLQPESNIQPQEVNSASTSVVLEQPNVVNQASSESSPVTQSPVVETAVPVAETSPVAEPVAPAVETSSQKVTLTLDPNAVGQARTVDTQASQAVENNANIANPVVSNEPSVAVEPVNVLNMPTADSTAPAVDATQTQESVVSEELRIEVTGASSWITVRGTKGKRLAEKLYNSGEVLSFNDNEQYRLTIGAPANVKIYYKGQPVPLLVDGRVARIRLPLHQ